MDSIRCVLLAFLSGASLAAWPPFAAAQANSGFCVGDCNGDGEVTVGDILLLVNIAVGAAGPAACAAGTGGAPVDVALIVRAVNNALAGCPPAPAGTATPTPSPNPTFTPTPAAPSVAGNWSERRPTLASSNCNSSTRNVLQQALAAQPSTCAIVLTQSGNQVHAADCSGDHLDGVVDAGGTATFDQLPVTESVSPTCSLAAGGTLVVPLTRSPTTATYAVRLVLTGSCSPFASCTATVTSQWTRR